MNGGDASAELPYEALIGLLQTAETLWNASRIFFSRWNLSPSQFNVLNLLYWQTEGCTQIELSRRLIMHRSNITGLVGRLEQRGLVRRRQLAGDRRSLNVCLTPAGKKMVGQIHPHYHRAATAVWNGAPENKIRQLLSQLQIISQNAEKTAKAAFPTKRPKGKAPKTNAIP